MQGLLELANVAYVGAGVVGSAVGMDKELMRRVFCAEDLPQVDYEVVRRARWERDRAAVLQHLDDDQYFHRCRVFVEISGTLAVAFRDRLPGTSDYRPGVLGHITSELVLDGVLIERDPGRLEQYYEAMAGVDAFAVQEAVNGMARGGTTERLVEMVSQFCQRRFLGDYVDPERLLYRLNQVMRRIKLASLPDEVLPVIERGRELVEPRVSELLGWTPPEPDEIFGRTVESPEERTEAQ